MRGTSGRARKAGLAGVAFALACSTVCLAGTSIGAATALSVVSSPDRPGPARLTLSGVACPAATTCFAVGMGSDDSPYIQQWNGTSWSVSPGALPAGASDGTLAAVACASTTMCFAVGHADFASSVGSQTLIEQWNGSSWSVVASPDNPPQYASALTGVSCPSSNVCFAVGTDLIERWDGSTWQNAPGPNDVGSVFHELQSVSCASTTSCFAVGDDGSAFPTTTITERWDGSSWTIVASPSPAPSFGFGDDALLSVSCPLANTCTAVGTVGSDPLIERWNGTKWAVSTGVEPANGGALDGVVCTSATSCFAVGTETTPQFAHPALIERWNGTAWSQSTSPDAGAYDDSLQAVSCFDADTCMAAGFAVTPADHEAGFAPQWNGTKWSTTAQPLGTQDRLVSVSCVSATGCFAVGDSMTASGDKTLVERWNGSTWTIVPSANPSGATDATLVDVSCATMTSCVAVGTSSNFRVLVERWNGSRWSIVAAPRLVDDLMAVSCPTVTVCFVAGMKVVQGANLFVARLHGTKWTRVQNAHVHYNDYLYDISCVSVTSCAAVGYSGSDLPDNPIVEHWNGKTWTTQVGRAAGNRMVSVSCTSATSCLAVGGVTKRWNGKTWANVATPDGNAVVSCASAADCLAVGGPDASQWNGKTWSKITGPDPAGSLSGVSCVGTTCFAVGGSTTGNATRTLVERSS